MKKRSFISLSLISLSLVLFALSTQYSLSLAFVFLAGLAQAIAWTVIATLILRASSLEEIRPPVTGAEVRYS